VFSGSLGTCAGSTGSTSRANSRRSTSSDDDNIGSTCLQMEEYVYLKLWVKLGHPQVVPKWHCAGQPATTGLFNARASGEKLPFSDNSAVSAVRSLWDSERGIAVRERQIQWRKITGKSRENCGENREELREIAGRLRCCNHTSRSLK